MCNLQRHPQIKATRVLLRDFSDLIHKMSHRMALNLKKDSSKKIPGVENELISLRQLHNFSVISIAMATKNVHTYRN